jgi:hypothetical protein
MSGNVSVDNVKQGVTTLIHALSNIRKKHRDVLTCDQELGKWVVRLNGIVIEEFFRSSSAKKLIAKIEAGLANKK